MQTQEATEIVTKTALKDDVLALLLFTVIVGIGFLLWYFGRRITDAAVKYLEKQSAAMEAIHAEIKDLRKDLGG